MSAINKVKTIFLTVMATWLLLSITTTAKAAILFQEDSFADVGSEGIIIDSLDQASGDIVIQFGSTLAETIRWNATDLRFEFSNAIDLNSNQIYEARIENAAAMPGGAGGLGAGGTGRIIELTATDGIAPGCTGPTCAAGTYVWNGASWIPLVGGAPTVTTASKVVTVGPVGKDYTSIAAAAAYLNTVSAGIMLVDPGTFSVTTTVDLENIQIIGKDSSETIIDISGAGVLQVKDTNFEDLTIDVDSGISAVSGLDIKYNAASDSSVQFERADAVVGTGKYLMDSTAGTPPISTINFANSTQSGGNGSLLRTVAASGLSSSSTILVDDQLGLNPLKIEDWPVTIIGGGNVLTTGTISTVPNRTILVSAGMNLQEAIDSLGSSGGTIKLLIGTHDLSSELVITNNNISIVGEGPGTILRTQSGTWTGGTGENDAVIQVGISNGTAPQSNIIISNFKMDVGSNTHGISVNGGSENRVLDMIVESTAAKTNTHTGIVFTDGASALGEKFTAARNIINTNTAVNRWVDGIHFDGNADFPGQLFGYGNGIRDSIISENIVSEAQETCYAFSEVSASAVFSNRARDIGFSAGAFGMFFNDAEDIMIIDNTMEGANAAATGISLYNNVDNSTVIGNAVRGGPVNYSSGIDNASVTNSNNIITNNQLESVATRIIDNGTATKLETNHHRATTNPTLNDDVADGFEVGTIWINTSSDTSYISVDHTLGAAVWQAMGGSSSGSGGLQSGATPPVTCDAGNSAAQFMDTDSGIVYVCDTSNGRNEWLSQQDIVIFGEDSGGCGSGADPNSDVDCNVNWGDGIGSDTGTSIGFYMPHPITITGYGFSEDNDACSSGSFDLEVWSTGSAANDNAYSFESNIATGLTGQAHNSNSSNVDVAGNQYILWGIDNNCGQSIDDWNLVIYYRYRHP